MTHVPARHHLGSGLPPTFLYTRYWDNTIQPQRQHAVYGAPLPGQGDDNGNKQRVLLDHQHVFLDVNGQPLMPSSPGDYIPSRCLLELTLDDIVEQDPESGSWQIMAWPRLTAITAKSLHGSTAPAWYNVIRMLENARTGLFHWPDLLHALQLHMHSPPEWYTRRSKMFDVDAVELFKRERKGGGEKMLEPGGKGAATTIRHIEEAIGKSRCAIVGKVWVEGMVVNVETGVSLEQHLTQASLRQRVQASQEAAQEAKRDAMQAKELDRIHALRNRMPSAAESQPKGGEGREQDGSFIDKAHKKANRRAKLKQAQSFANIGTADVRELERQRKIAEGLDGNGDGDSDHEACDSKSDENDAHGGGGGDNGGGSEEDSDEFDGQVHDRATWEGEDDVQQYLFTYEIDGEALGDERIKHRRIPGLVTRNVLKPRPMQLRLYRIAGLTSDSGHGIGASDVMDETEVDIMHRDAHCRAQRVADSIEIRHAGVAQEEFWVDCHVVAIEKNTGMYEVEVDAQLQLGVAKYNRKIGFASFDPWTKGMTRADGAGDRRVGVLHVLRQDLRQGEPQYHHLLGKPWGVAVMTPLMQPTGRTMTGDVVVADHEQHCLHVFSGVLEGKANPEKPIKVMTGYDHTIGTRGSRRGELHGPRGICIDSDGRIIVADTFNNRVQAFRFVPRGQTGKFFHREPWAAPWLQTWHGYGRPSRTVGTFKTSHGFASQEDQWVVDCKSKA